ncbi:MAG: hypothetical protein HY052_08755 [Proteobacteria bacterium]|nr:hypothetical protein [Pseudomonadota bacterium]
MVGYFCGCFQCEQMELAIRIKGLKARYEGGQEWAAAMKIPRQWILTTLYMAFIYCVIIVLIQYAKHHPLTEAVP